MSDVHYDELDAAIIHLENKVKGLELSLKLGRSRREDAARREIKAYSAAIASMREMKRSRIILYHNHLDECEYCCVKSWNRKPLAKWGTSFDNWLKQDHEIGIADYSDGRFEMTSYPRREGPTFEIHYCPVCGRHLGD